MLKDGYYWKIVIALIFIALDILTGLWQAFVNNCFESKKMRQGLGHKGTEIIAIVIAMLLDFANMKLELNLPIEVLTYICIYLVFMEIMSCLENIDKAYPGILPDKVKNVLQSAATSSGVELTDQNTTTTTAEESKTE